MPSLLKRHMLSERNQTRAPRKQAAFVSKMLNYDSDNTASVSKYWAAGVAALRKRGVKNNHFLIELRPLPDFNLESRNVVDKHGVCANVRGLAWRESRADKPIGTSQRLVRWEKRPFASRRLNLQDREV